MLLSVVAPGCALDELERMAKTFAFRAFKFLEFKWDAKRWTALGNDTRKDETLDPDFSIGQPETDFYAYS